MLSCFGPVRFGISGDGRRKCPKWEKDGDAQPMAEAKGTLWATTRLAQLLLIRARGLCLKQNRPLSHIYRTPLSRLSTVSSPSSSPPPPTLPSMFSSSSFWSPHLLPGQCLLASVSVVVFAELFFLELDQFRDHSSSLSMVLLQLNIPPLLCSFLPTKVSLLSQFSPPLPPFCSIFPQNCPEFA